MTSPAELATCLDELRRRRGLSYERMEAAAGRLPAKPGRPSWEPLAKSTVGEIVTGRRMTSRAKLMTFLAVCEVPASELDDWLAAWDRASAATMRRPARGMLVRDARPGALGVHAPIQVTESAASLPLAPTYVLRDVDARLRSALAAGRRFVLLVGGSSVGKTRSAYEAIRAELADWWLIQPSDAAELAELAADAGARRVVWLDEFQHYLTGGLTPATMRALLNRFVVVGTVWPDHYFRFAVPPGPGGDDLFWREREVLKLADVIDIADRLTPAEEQRAYAAAARDPRIQVALDSSDYGMTQVLAAAPQLVRQWEQAPDAYSHAIITAAIDARRLGVESELPAEFLEAAVPDYLGPSDRAGATPGWFARALEYATQKLYGATAVLSPRPGPGMGTIAGYAVADYVLQHGAAKRRAVVPGDQVWRAYAGHLTSGADLWRVGKAAADRALLRHAERLYRAAAQSSAEARESLIDLLSRQGRVTDAEQVMRTAAAAGDPLKRVQLGNFLAGRGRPAEAEQVLREAVIRRDWGALSSLAGFLADQGRTDGAYEVWQRAVVGDTSQWWGFIRFLRDHRPAAEVERALWDGAAADLGTRNELVMMLKVAGREAEAEQVLRRSAAAGHLHARSILAMHLKGERRDAEYEAAWRDCIRHADGDGDVPEAREGSANSSSARAGWPRLSSSGGTA